MFECRRRYLGRHACAAIAFHGPTRCRARTSYEHTSHDYDECDQPADATVAFSRECAYRKTQARALRDFGQLAYPRRRVELVSGWHRKQRLRPVELFAESRNRSDPRKL